MALPMENIVVDLLPKGERPVLHVAQYDNARTFFITLQNNGVDYAVPESVTVELRVRKVDGHVVTIAPKSITSNILEFTTTEQMCACFGHNIGEISIIFLDGPMCSILIDIEVQRDVLQGGVDSASDIHNLETQIKDIIDDELPGKLNELVPPIVESELENYYTKSDTDDLLANKADADDVYTKSDTDDLLANKADADDVYTKTDIDNKLDYLYPINADYIPFIEGLISGTYDYYDLGDLTWGYNTNPAIQAFATGSLANIIRRNVNDSTVATWLLCKGYTSDSINNTIGHVNDKRISVNASGGVYLSNFDYTDAPTFKTAMTGVYIIFELATPKTPTITQAELETLIKAYNNNMVNVILKV